MNKTIFNEIGLVQDSLQLHLIINDGMDLRYVENFAKLLSLSRDEFFEVVNLGVPYISGTGKNSINKKQSEKFYSLIVLMELYMSRNGGWDALVSSFYNLACESIPNNKKIKIIDLLDTRVGADLVRDIILGRV
jgi:hypothetical protein